MLRWATPPGEYSVMSAPLSGWLISRFDPEYWIEATPLMTSDSSRQLRRCLARGQHEPARPDSAGAEDLNAIDAARRIRDDERSGRGRVEAARLNDAAELLADLDQLQR